MRLIAKERIFRKGYKSVHHYMDIEGQILPALPFEKGGISVFGKEGPAGRQGEILTKISLFNYRFTSKFTNSDSKEESYADFSTLPL